MIYFFRRKVDGYAFAIDDEKQASSLFYGRYFARDFEFMGRSDGKTFEAVMKEAPHMSQEQREDVWSGKDSHEDLQKQIVETQKRAFLAELEKAVTMGDKIPPRSFKQRDLNGGPLQSNSPFIYHLAQQMK